MAAAVKGDFSSFAAIKHFATDEQLDARTQSIHNALELLPAQSNDFAVHPDGCPQRTEEVDASSP